MRCLRDIYGSRCLRGIPSYYVVIAREAHLVNALLGIRRVTSERRCDYNSFALAVHSYIECSPTGAPSSINVRRYTTLIET